MNNIQNSDFCREFGLSIEDNEKGLEKMQLEETLNHLYDLEINVTLMSCWDGHWNVAIGDQMNGIKESGHHLKMHEVKFFLLEFLKRELKEQEKRLEK